MFIYEIAYELRIPVYVLLEDMPYAEFRRWAEFFERRPVGWREDNRTSMILQAFGIKERPEKIFRSLEIIKAQLNEKKNDGQIQESTVTLKSKLAALMQRSSEKSPWE